MLLRAHCRPREAAALVTGLWVGAGALNMSGNLGSFSTAPVQQLFRWPTRRPQCPGGSAPSLQLGSLGHTPKHMVAVPSQLRARGHKHRCSVGFGRKTRLLDALRASFQGTLTTDGEARAPPPVLPVLAQPRASTPTSECQVENLRHSTLLPQTLAHGQSRVVLTLHERPQMQPPPLSPEFAMGPLHQMIISSCFSSKKSSAWESPGLGVQTAGRCMVGPSWPRTKKLEGL